MSHQTNILENNQTSLHLTLKLLMDGGTHIAASLIIVQNDEQMFSLYQTTMSCDKASSIKLEDNKIISLTFLLQNDHKGEKFIK